MNTICRLFGHVFTPTWVGQGNSCLAYLTCKRCLLTCLWCNACNLTGFQESLGDRLVPCSYGPHSLLIIDGRRTSPPGHLSANLDIRWDWMRGHVG